MTTKDLMIGDFVQFDEDTCVIEELRVDGTAVLVAMNTDLTSVDGDQVDVEELSPIELTEDILVKNGFEKTTNDWNRHGRPLIIFESMGFPTISIHADIDMKHFWVHGTIDLTYVHQLQHLIRLVGVQKEIEL